MDVFFSLCFLSNPLLYFCSLKWHIREEEQLYPAKLVKKKCLSNILSGVKYTYKMAVYSDTQMQNFYLYIFFSISFTISFLSAAE